MTYDRLVELLGPHGCEVERFYHGNQSDRAAGYTLHGPRGSKRTVICDRAGDIDVHAVQMIEGWLKDLAHRGRQIDARRSSARA